MFSKAVCAVRELASLFLVYTEFHTKNEIRRYLVVGSQIQISKFRETVTNASELGKLKITPSFLLSRSSPSVPSADREHPVRGALGAVLQQAVGFL